MGFEVSNRLFLIAGNLEPFVKTGGTITAEEVQWLVAQINACAQQARANELHTAWLAEHLNPDRTQGNVPPPPPPGSRPRFGLIEGGRA